jgi:hypothetical protein
MQKLKFKFSDEVDPDNIELTVIILTAVMHLQRG